MVKKILIRALAPAVIVAIWFLSSQQTLPLPHSVVGVDKIAHFIAYASLAACMVLWIPTNIGIYTDKGSQTDAERKTSATYHKALLLCFVLASLYGVLDEFHQSFVPGRDSSFGDIIADTLGAAVGTGVMAKIREIFFRIKNAGN
ncbi:MAG TPA: VanZ family protein [Treponema sp.]|nr:VanZ family protein [Treponema sp.]